MKLVERLYCICYKQYVFFDSVIVALLLFVVVGSNKARMEVQR